MKHILLALALTFAAGIASAEHGVSYIQFLENEGVILPASNGESITAQVNLPLYPGDTLNTRSTGRMIVALSDGNLSFIDQQSRIELRALAYTDGYPDRRTFLYLENGTAALHVPREPVAGEEPVLGCSYADVYFNHAGLVRLDVNPRRSIVKVLEGEVEIATSRGSAIIGQGEMANIYEDGYIERFSIRANRVDDFGIWIQRTIQKMNDSESRRYTGDRLSSYSYVLDDYGTWVYLSDYSTYAWRPVVSVDWRPYSQGYWGSYYGNNHWVGYEPWGYVTNHYGRWVLSPGYGWIWVPGTSWAASWVYWAVGPGWIGWCPIGYYDWWWWGYDPWYYRPPHCWDCYHRFNGHLSVWAMARQPWIITSPGGFVSKDLPHRIYTPEQVAKIRNDKAYVSTKHLPVSRDEMKDHSAAYHRLSKSVTENRKLDTLFSMKANGEMSQGAREILKSSTVRAGGGVSDPFTVNRSGADRTPTTPVRVQPDTPTYQRRGDLLRSQGNQGSPTISQERGGSGATILQRPSSSGDTRSGKSIVGLDRNPISERPSSGSRTPVASPSSPSSVKQSPAYQRPSSTSTTKSIISGTSGRSSRQPITPPSTGSSTSTTREKPATGSSSGSKTKSDGYSSSRSYRVESRSSSSSVSTRPSSTATRPTYSPSSTRSVSSRSSSPSYRPSSTSRSSSSTQRYSRPSSSSTGSSSSRSIRSSRSSSSSSSRSGSSAKSSSSSSSKSSSSSSKSSSSSSSSRSVSKRR